MKGKLFSVLIFLFMCQSIQAQYTLQGRSFIRTLADTSFLGRGYAYRGDLKAATWIENYYKKLNLSTLGNSYRHPFTFSVNTFPKRMLLQINQSTLNPGLDYIIYLSSPSTDGKYRIITDPADTIHTRKSYLNRHGYSGSILFTTNLAITSPPTGFNGIIWMIPPSDPLIWRVSDGTIINKWISGKIYSNLITSKDTSATLTFDSDYIKNLEAVNIAAYIPGKTNPEKLVLITAHYDHLGLMGRKTVYPGGQDNASGVAMMLDLATYFSNDENRLPFSIGFVAFSAEEMHLFGSTSFAQNLPWNASDINLVLNLDMMCTGSDGIMVVNGKEWPELIADLNKINTRENYLKEIKIRPNAQNSDHFPFTKLGIPAIFFYTIGDEYTFYHTPKDTYNVPLTKYNEVFLLLKEFINSCGDKTYRQPKQ